MHKLSTRCRNRTWEVLVPAADIEFWVQCESIADARQMAASGSLAFDALQRNRAGVEIAQELEDCARLFWEYDCHDRAIWLAEHAKFARGEPSIFDASLISADS